MDPVTVFKLIELGLSLGVKVFATFTKKPDGAVTADVQFTMNDVKVTDLVKEGNDFLASLNKPTP